MNLFENLQIMKESDDFDTNIITVKHKEVAHPSESTPEEAQEYKEFIEHDYDLELIKYGALNRDYGYEIIRGKVEDIERYLDEIFGYDLDNKHIEILDENLQMMKEAENWESEYQNYDDSNKYSDNELYEIRQGLENGVDVTKDIVKEADSITDDPAWEDTFDDVVIFTADYTFNLRKYTIDITETDEGINSYVNGDYHGTEQKRNVHDDHDLEYLAFKTAVTAYMNYRFHDKQMSPEGKIIKDKKVVEKVVESTELRQFTTRDWFAWGGAEKFKDGSEPLILEGEYATLIVGGIEAEEDGAYVSIYYSDDENSHSACRVFSLKEQAIKFANRIKTIVDEEIDEEELKDLAFDLVV